jgi:1,6-anhydro-N-acetylmuramate kinase
MAFDTGSGNVMLDHAARVLLGRPYDADGRAAASGEVDEAQFSESISAFGGIADMTGLATGSTRW